MSPEYGCQINACDRELFLSLAGTFACSDDPAMPKSPWCQVNPQLSTLNPKPCTLDPKP